MCSLPMTNQSHVNQQSTHIIPHFSPFPGPRARGWKTSPPKLGRCAPSTRPSTPWSLGPKGESAGAEKPWKKAGFLGKNQGLFLLDDVFGNSWMVDGFFGGWLDVWMF